MCSSGPLPPARHRQISPTTSRMQTATDHPHAASRTAACKHRRCRYEQVECSGAQQQANQQEPRPDTHDGSAVSAAWRVAPGRTGYASGMHSNQAAAAFSFMPFPTAIRHAATNTVRPGATCTCSKRSLGRPWARASQQPASPRHGVISRKMLAGVARTHEAILGEYAPASKSGTKTALHRGGVAA